MSNIVNKQRITVVTTGGNYTAYGTAYGDKSIRGEIIKLDYSGAALGVSGTYILTESGNGVAGTIVAGSCAADLSISWAATKYPAVPCVYNLNTQTTGAVGSEFSRPYMLGVPLCTVSGTNAGSLFVDITYREMR
jgi:hypothetical protein